MRRVGMGALGVVLVFDQPYFGSAETWVLPVAASAWPWLVRLPMLGSNRRAATSLLCLDTVVFIGVCVVVGAHPMVLLTVVVVLSSSALALLGCRVLFVWAIASASSLLTTAIFAKHNPLAGVPAAALMAAALMWLLCLWLASMSFSKSRRLGAARNAALQRQDATGLLNARLSRYLPTVLVQLLTPAPSALLPLTRVRAAAVFVDLVGFTRLSRERSATELEAILGSFIARSNAIAEDSGGFVVRVLGDAVLAIFPVTAQRTVLDAQQQSKAFARALVHCPSGAGHRVEARAGLALGDCLLGDWGGDRLEFTAIGEPVNRAARLQQLALPGEVRCDWEDDALAPFTAPPAAARSAPATVGVQQGPTSLR